MVVKLVEILGVMVVVANELRSVMEFACSFRLDFG